jgi:hypothetical protein
MGERLTNVVLLGPSGSPQLGDEIADRLGHRPYVIEGDPFARKRFERSRFEVLGDNFEAHELGAAPWPAKGGYDVIIQHPPFGVEPEHIRHAWTLLAPGGRLVSTSSEPVWESRERRFEKFRDWLQRIREEQGAKLWRGLDDTIVLDKPEDE